MGHLKDLENDVLAIQFNENNKTFKFKELFHDSPHHLIPESVETMLWSLPPSVNTINDISANQQNKMGNSPRVEETVLTTVFEIMQRRFVELEKMGVEYVDKMKAGAERLKGEIMNEVKAGSENGLAFIKFCHSFLQESRDDQYWHSQQLVRMSTGMPGC